MMLKILFINEAIGYEVKMNDKRNLHTLLEEMGKTHHKDIKDIINGRFNENKLLQKTVGCNNISTRWETSRPKKSTMGSMWNRNNLPKLDHNVDKMTQAITDFSMGPQGCIPPLPQQKPSHLSQLADHVENLSIPDILNQPSMINSFKGVTDCPKVPPTKREQYQKGKKLQINLSNSVALPKINNKVDDEDYKVRANNEDEDISSQNIVRKWNDDYQPIQINQLQLKEIEALKKNISNELSENEKLTTELNDIRCDSDIKIEKAALDEAVNKSTSEKENPVRMDIEQVVSDLQVKIQEKHHELERIRKDQKENYVPLAVCERLENCIKETEVDIQKLCKQNEFLEHNLEELEEELEHILVNNGVKEVDARLLWKKVSYSKLQDM